MIYKISFFFKDNKQVGILKTFNDDYSIVIIEGVPTFYLNEDINLISYSTFER